ncbi:uncharacterized protein A1O9_11467 [Exophiala aquamarina CBS 119918]|uniref:Arrestin-like N-terminal domain-containing protein n=1 Tax=Exophiala aquamarina CBS 119918 TaxID=1182545 RepID=A0A072NXL2_9EURO|nr:uncharacterized protein A1O9_11467 [Exophiala aquamarina CBS 119918]KEF52624.1 hypothetical protein A1O9_11467 [Exophiala aquamarina CBS 119918]
MPLETLLTNPNKPVPRSRSILSYFSNPLANHARNMFDLVIEPEDPFRVYSPGQTVKGHITLTVTKGFDITHLIIALHGYAKVYKHQVTANDAVPSAELLMTGRGPRNFEYHGNGLASLFQNEQVLCGNGFLKKQVYKFAFEVAFPNKSLPSTIEFERGNIAYMLTVTLTRPTTISPTITRSTKLKFQDNIDIEAMYTPKSRVISLEPVHRRGKVKAIKAASSVTTQTTQNTQTTSSAGQLTRNNTQNSSATRSSNSVCNPPLSPAPSDDTAHSNTTATSTPSFQVIDADSPPAIRSPHTSDTRSNTTSSSSHTITATTELPRHGALPGDTVPIRVSITHTKADVRGMVIATLYRQGRVDMHPAIPLATRGKEKKAEYEDVYPKSRTGLGGLYFANGSPSSVFRKDLAQSSTLMVVNPHTMSADITTSVRIPDTAFPTIANVPGGMITFTYHIEVVVDLFGRLNETRILPRLTSSEPTFTHSMENGNQLTSDWSNNILDTTQLRRTKSVITFEMSIIVGTVDSGRKQRQTKQAEIQKPSGDPQWGEDGWYDGYHHEYDDQYYDENGYQYYDGYGYDPTYYPDYQPQTAEVIPPPEAHEEMDEKARLRRQEQLLLPSQPPQEGESSSSALLYAPTAPMLQADHVSESADTHHDGSATPSTVHPASVASARSGDTIRPYSASPPPAPPAFTENEPTDDKQELERRRLLAQASAPPADDMQTEPSSSHGATSTATAPTINEEDEYNVQTLHHDHTGPDLPQYER